MQLKEELSKRGLPCGGRKDELVARLAGAMELEETETKVKQVVEKVIGKDVSPYVGMRVRHVSGNDHRSSRGLLGTIEIIPGRGAIKPDERSVSVRWDADKSDVRGPYYTGEPCDRGSGIGTEKFDLVTLEEVEEEEPEQPTKEATPKAARKDSVPAPVLIEIEGLQEDSEMDGEDKQSSAAQVAAEKAPTKGKAKAEDEDDEGLAADADTNLADTERLASPGKAASEHASNASKKMSGSKRNSDGEVKGTAHAHEAVAQPLPAPTSVQALQQRLNQCKQAWTQRLSTDPNSPASKVLQTPASAKAKEDDRTQEPDEQALPMRTTRHSSAKKAAATALETPAKDAAAPAAASSKKASTGKKSKAAMPSAMEPTVSMCSSAKKASLPVAPSFQPHESVQHFRAIISRINAEKEAAVKPPRSSTSRVPGALASSAAAAASKEEAAAAQASKPVTWPPPAAKPAAIKVADGVGGDFGRSSGSGLTKELLSSHVKLEGKHSMLKTFASDLPAMNGGRGVMPEASVDSVVDTNGKRKSAGGGSRGAMDAAARQQRAAENRAKMQEELKRKAAEQEQRRLELEKRKNEAERIGLCFLIAFLHTGKCGSACVLDLICV